MLQIPLSHHNDIQKVLELENFYPLCEHLGPNARKEFGMIVCENVIDHLTTLDDPDKVIQALQLKIAMRLGRLVRRQIYLCFGRTSVCLSRQFRKVLVSQGLNVPVS